MVKLLWRKVYWLQSCQTASVTVVNTVGLVIREKMGELSRQQFMQGPEDHAKNLHFT